MSEITLSLISHTNAGKTTLARTLLARDVGEVRDAPHVTTEATSYPLVETAGGDVLTLWDTPGFADSARLARRLAQEGNPVGWFLSEVWDRFRDRAFWLTQQAVRNVRDRADVVLYLLNAAEDPAEAGYLDAELEVLAYLRKPVLALLNQTGPPRGAQAEREEIARWQATLAKHAHVRGVLPLDAFARCWVQEFALFDAVAPLLPQEQQVAFARLAAEWRRRRFEQFDQAMAALAQPLANAVCARVVVPRAAMLQRLGTAIGIGAEAKGGGAGAALAELSARASADVKSAADALIDLHGLSGRAAAEVEARVGADLAREGPLHEGKAAAMGGVLSGAAGGLAADLASGGLTLGAGVLAGAVLGALGGAGIARAVNVVRGRTEDIVRFDDAFILRLAPALILRYLAVAHYGRGRGDYAEAEYPAFWRREVEAAVAARREAFAGIFAQRAPTCDSARIAAALTPLLRETTRAVLGTLYPGALAGTEEGRHHDRA